MRIKPAPDRAIIDPDRNDYLPADGRDVPLTAYWRRRLDDGDVIEDTEAVAAKPVTQSSRKGA